MSAIMFDGSYRCEKCGMMVHNGVQHAKWCDGKGKNYAELIAENTALKEQLKQGRVTKRFAELSDENARYKKALESISRDCDGCTPDEGECAITECVVMTAKIALQEGGEG
jgi:hypothetical protein